LQLKYLQVHEYVQSAATLFPLQIACLKATRCRLLFRTTLTLQGLEPQVPSKYQQITEQAQQHMQAIGSEVGKSCTTKDADTQEWEREVGP